ncbi:AbrB/MazE/SpoVT family DNA-binding domain-containing protein [Deinococcus saxicola]|uniref:AbrB/MazE/SpoVT family DNA-binding domain-containing protein n=1 Tax=Deinococcus saxicola TaxID=249406 RepID=UPI0039EF229E
MTSSMDHSQSQSSKVGRAYRVVLPPEVRTALGVQEGDRVIFQIRDSEIRVQSLREFTRALQGSYANLLSGAADELITERRAEAERE